VAEDQGVREGPAVHLSIPRGGGRGRGSMYYAQGGFEILFVLNVERIHPMHVIRVRVKATNFFLMKHVTEKSRAMKRNHPTLEFSSVFVLRPKAIVISCFVLHSGFTCHQANLAQMFLARFMFLVKQSMF
jgi:hypothetical protein